MPHGEPLSKSLFELQRLCSLKGLKVEQTRRKRYYLERLRNEIWSCENPGERMPEQIQPMLLRNWEDLAEAERESLSAEDGRWIVQPKLDGVRVLIHIERGRIRITGRNWSDVTFRLSEYQENLPHLGSSFTDLENTILDGELVCPKDSVHTSTTQTTFSLQATTAILNASPELACRIQDDNRAHLQFHAFDIIRLRGQDLTPQPLSARLALLSSELSNIDDRHVRIVPSMSSNKLTFHHQLIEQGFEGSVWKQSISKYEPGKRVRTWIKRKRAEEITGFVSGFKSGTRGNHKLIGTVQFSVRDAQRVTMPLLG